MAAPGPGTICIWNADTRQVGDVQYTQGEQYPAIQIRVVAGTTVNLKVFSDSGPNFAVLEVPEDDTQVTPNSWSYPAGTF
jgi:hypothetical protein